MPKPAPDFVPLPLPVDLEFWTARPDEITGLQRATLYWSVPLVEGMVGIVPRFDIGLHRPLPQWLGQPNGFQTETFSNVPRDPYMGLPKHWMMRVTRLHAMMSDLGPLAEGWADSVALEWTYNRVRYAEGSLSEFVLGGRAADLVMRENLDYGVGIRLEKPVPRPLTIWVRWEGWLKAVVR